MRFTKRDLKWMFGNDLARMTDKEAKVAAFTIRDIIIGSGFECKTMYDIYVFRAKLELPSPKSRALINIFLRWVRYSDPEAKEWIVVEKKDEVKHAIFKSGIRSTPWTAIDEDPRLS